MDHEKNIREQGRFAPRLAEDIRALLGAVPFGAEVYRSRYELERLARPVVAVTGAEGVGKSTLVRALDEAGVTPGEWWEVASGSGPLSGRAEVFVLVTSAVQPLPLGELTLLYGLAESAPDLALRVVLTRADELASDELPGVQERVRKLLAEALPGRTISFVAVSGRTGAGIPKLREELLEALFLVQRDRLLEEVAAWGAALADLHALLEMRELAAVKPETLERLRTRLDGLLVEEGARIRGQLPGVVEQFLRGKEAALPRSRRQLTNALREAFVAKLRQEVEGIQPRLNQELAEALRGDVDTATTLALTNRFEGVLEAGPRFFDWQSARKAGAVGAAGAALVARVAGKPAGWAFAGAMLLGGLLGGLMGSASTVDTPEALREQVTEPLLRAAEQRLLQATQSSREDLARLCELLRKVIQVFSDPKTGAYDLAALQRVVALAEVSQKQLADELRAFVQEREADALLKKLNITWPGAESPAEATPAVPGKLTTGSEQA
jgi:hypothetical protein